VKRSMEPAHRPIIALHRPTFSAGYDVETLGLEEIAPRARDVQLSISMDPYDAHGRTDPMILEDHTEQARQAPGALRRCSGL
jgi:hypothetical protein